MIDGDSIGILIDCSDLRPRGRFFPFRPYPVVSAFRPRPPANGFDPYGITIVIKRGIHTYVARGNCSTICVYGVILLLDQRQLDSEFRTSALEWCETDFTSMLLDYAPDNVEP